MSTKMYPFIEIWVDFHFRFFAFCHPTTLSLESWMHWDFFFSLQVVRADPVIVGARGEIHKLGPRQNQRTKKITTCSQSKRANLTAHLLLEEPSPVIEESRAVEQALGKMEFRILSFRFGNFDFGSLDIMDCGIYKLGWENVDCCSWIIGNWVEA
ncbi:uncharacterized protein LOC111397864 [Olea europaea var. sylvestris]|uniref:uncharacterized protein LOC111397864 n=1 Tax=Olea europaea var. sylvestris TaxID=158386 RepID=UPI000C1D1F2F|nr:uncharacterized protein LOC111397864 [Olea europaea var. sylvestris]